MEAQLKQMLNANQYDGNTQKKLKVVEAKLKACWSSNNAEGPLKSETVFFSSIKSCANMTHIDFLVDLACHSYILENFLHKAKRWEEEFLCDFIKAAEFGTCSVT